MNVDKIHVPLMEIKVFTTLRCGLAGTCSSAASCFDSPIRVCWLNMPSANELDDRFLLFSLKWIFTKEHATTPSA